MRHGDGGVDQAEGERARGDGPQVGVGDQRRGSCRARPTRAAGRTAGPARTPGRTAPPGAPAGSRARARGRRPPGAAARTGSRLRRRRAGADAASPAPSRRRGPAVRAMVGRWRRPSGAPVGSGGRGQRRGRGGGAAPPRPCVAVVSSRAARSSSRRRRPRAPSTSPPLAMSTKRSSRTREPSTEAQPGAAGVSLALDAAAIVACGELVVTEQRRERGLGRREAVLGQDRLVLVAEHQRDRLPGRGPGWRLGRDRDVRAAEQHRRRGAVGAGQREDADVLHHVRAARLGVLDQAA